MAIHANSTTAPFGHPLLLQAIVEIGRDLIEVKRTIGHGNFLPWIEAEFGMSSWTANQFMNAEKAFGSKIEIISNLPPTILYALAAPSLPELLTPPLLPADVAHGGVGTVPHGGAPILLPYSGEQIQHDVEFDLSETGDLKAARTLHLRRQLAQAAEHGAALLAALGLPRLVDPDFLPLDPVAVGDALDLAIATLDAMDGDTDLEPSLGAPENHPGRFHIDMDGHHHVARARHTLGDQSQWAAGGSRDTDAEAVNEDGDDLDPGEMEEGDQEPWLGAAEGAQHYRGGDLDLEQDGEIERPWWGPHAAGWNHDGGRYA